MIRNSGSMPVLAEHAEHQRHRPLACGDHGHPHAVHLTNAPGRCGVMQDRQHDRLAGAEAQAITNDSAIITP